MKVIEKHVLEVGSQQFKRVEQFGLLDDGRYVVFHKAGSPTLISAEEFAEIEKTGKMPVRSNLLG